MFVYHNWDVTRRFIDRLDAAEHAFVTSGEKMKPWNPMRRYSTLIFENFLSALDAPGEWFLARDGSLYYKPPRSFDITLGNKSDSILVTEEAAATGKRGVKVTDAPDLKSNWMPLLVYPTHFKQGVLSNSFDLRIEKASMINYEWRDYSEGGYKTGPRLSIRDATLSLGRGTTMALPENQWLRFEIESGVGPDSTGTWSLTVTVPGQSPRVFKDLAHADSGFKTLTWCGFSSLADTVTSYELDNFTLNPAGNAQESGEKP